MDIKELRIGNIVKIDDEYLGLIEGKVKLVNELGQLLLSDSKGDGRLFVCGAEDIFPILITEELLEKCGFERNNDMPPYILDLDKGCRVYMFKNTYGWILQYVRYGVGYDETVSKNIVMFVHQLQNAYYLATGKELEIKL